MKVIPATGGVRGGSLAWVYFAATVLGTAVYIHSESAPVKAALIVGLSLAGVVAVALGICLHRPAERFVWLGVGGMLLFWTIGWALWESDILTTGAPPPTDSLVNVVFQIGYPFAVLGLLYLSRKREPGAIALIDAAIIATSALVVSWAFLLHSYIGDGALPELGRALQVIWAVLDIAVLAAALRLLVSPGRRPPALLLLVSSVVLVAASNLLWNWSTQFGGYAPGAWGDAGWVLFPAFLGAAALHPSMKYLDGSTLSVQRSFGLDRLVLIAVVAVIPIFVLSDIDWEDMVRALPVVVLSALLWLLIIAKMGLLLRESCRLSEVDSQNERLRELDGLKDSFVASVSHELRTPLTSIRGYLELVREGEAGDLTPDQDRFLGIVARNADRLLRVVGDLLFVAQVDAAKISLELAEVDLNAVALESADAARPHALDKSIELVLTRQPLATVRGDAGRLSQLLDNLVSNALKFTPEGGRVELRVATQGDRALLEVSDTGMGISEADQRRLFERFYRTNEANERAIQGTGLGLSIAKAIVEGHGGTIRVSSVLGQGTTFHVDLPLDGSAQADDPEPVEEVMV